MRRNPNWRARASALLQAARDVAPPGHPPAGGNGSQRHAALFGRYLKALRAAHESATGWWGAILEAEEERTQDEAVAAENVDERRPVGPVAHGEVIAAVRQFWLECAALNEKVAPAERVPPEEFVLGWLIKREQNELAEFLSAFPFWPIGLDFEGHWV
jgi:hypothetical protein